MADMTVANTIIAQLGGRRFQIMTGAKNFIGTDNSVSFKIGGGAKKRINGIRIALNGRDLYDVEFFAGTKVVDKHNDIYAEDLQDVFTEVTGFYTSLR